MAESTGHTHSVSYQSPRSLFRRLLRRALKSANIVRWRLRAPNYHRTYHIRANQLNITVLPTVFHPRWHFTSTFLASECQRLLSPSDSVLEIGTGTGIVALSAARVAQRVVATDISPAAVRCAVLNASQNDLPQKVQFLLGDMFEPVASQSFDVILCNPPYLRGCPRNTVELGYLGGPNLEWISLFARQAHEHLNPGGRLICIFGDAADVPTLVNLLRQEGWQAKLIAKRDLLLEELTIWEFKH